MIQLTSEALPAELREEIYHYPAALFDDWQKKSWQKEQKFLQYDGGEPMLPPVTNSERIVLMASYAVTKALDNMPVSDERAIKIARCEVEASFIPSIRKVWHNTYGSYDGIYAADIELVAEELGVYEIIWPFDDDLMKKEAVRVEQQFSSVN